MSDARRTGAIGVCARNKSGNKVGDGYDVDPGDSVDVELLRDQHLDVENTDEGPGGDDDLNASGTYDRL